MVKAAQILTFQVSGASGFGTAYYTWPDPLIILFDHINKLSQATVFKRKKFRSISMQR
jgi:hypothetical protein